MYLWPPMTHIWYTNFKTQSFHPRPLNYNKKKLLKTLEYASSKIKFGFKTRSIRQNNPPPSPPRKNNFSRSFASGEFQNLYFQLTCNKTRTKLKKSLWSSKLSLRTSFDKENYFRSTVFLLKKIIYNKT